MHAIVLAGGKGTRLRPYTTSLPKPLVPIGDEYSILEIVMRQLARAGFTSVTLAIGHLGHLIRAYVQDGRQWGIHVTYAGETAPLGTIGPLLPLLNDLPEHFLVMNGDVLTDIDFGAVLKTHVETEAPLTVATFERQVKIDFGVLRAEAGKIVEFSEKPTIDYRVSMGVYGLSRATLEGYTVGKALGFDELVLDLLDRGQHPHEFLFNGHWLDIGRPDDYDQANEQFPMLRSAMLGDELELELDALSAVLPVYTD